jgi:hypothetical protein
MPAKAELIEFRGGFCIAAMTQACEAEGHAVGKCYALRYTPRNLADNGPATKFSIFDAWYGQNFTRESGSLIGSKFKAVRGTLIGRSGFQFESARMRITEHSPANPTLDTQFVSMVGNIRNFDDASGCDIEFNATGTKVVR